MFFLTIYQQIDNNNDKDEWMNNEIKNKINYTNTFYQQNLTDLDVVNELTSELSSTTSQRKSILKTFFNDRKIPVMSLFSLMANLHQILKKKLKYIS